MTALRAITGHASETGLAPLIETAEHGNHAKTGLLGSLRQAIGDVAGVLGVFAINHDSRLAAQMFGDELVGGFAGGRTRQMNSRAAMCPSAKRSALRTSTTSTWGEPQRPEISEGANS